MALNNSLSGERCREMDSRLFCQAFRQLTWLCRGRESMFWKESKTRQWAIMYANTAPPSGCHMQVAPVKLLGALKCCSGHCEPCPCIILSWLLLCMQFSLVTTLSLFDPSAESGHLNSVLVAFAFQEWRPHSHQLQGHVPASAQHGLLCGGAWCPIHML